MTFSQQSQQHLVVYCILIVLLVAAHAKDDKSEGLEGAYAAFKSV